MYEILKFIKWFDLTLLNRFLFFFKLRKLIISEKIEINQKTGMRRHRNFPSKKLDVVSDVVVLVNLQAIRYEYYVKSKTLFKFFYISLFVVLTDFKNNFALRKVI